MKVLEVFGEPILSGGQEAFVFEILKNINMKNLQIDCLTAYEWRNESYRQIVEGHGGAAYELGLPFQPGKCRMNIADPFRNFLQNHTYDVVHIHSGSISALAVMAFVADTAGVKKVIVHSHATGDNDNLKHKVLRFMASLSMRKHVSVYCACSKEAAVWKFMPLYARQAHIIKNGIDTSRFSFNPAKRNEYRKKLGITEACFVVGHVGRFSYEKNQAFLIHVFKNLTEKVTDSKLLLVGEGEDREKIEKQIQKLKLTDKVILTGNVRNVQDFLQVMDVFVFPSRFEGFGIVALEAQAAGLPVIASDCVPREAGIVNDMLFLNLKDTSTSVWVNEILKFKNYKRKDGAEIIKSAGYDIKSTSETIRSLYIKNSDEV